LLSIVRNRTKGKSMRGFIRLTSLPGALILVTFLLSNADGQRTPATPPNGGQTLQQASPGSYATSLAEDASSGLLLGPGDLIDIGVYNVPELATKARIGSNGNIYLPLIDYVHVAGLTTDQAQDLIQQKLTDGGFVKNPHVNVFVNEHASKGVSLLGEVSRPGIYPIVGQQHLFDLLSAAGGFTDKAGRSINITHRAEPSKPVVVPLTRNLSDNPQSNILISPGDTIIVRKADVIYVVGDVGHPSGFLMDNGYLTVMQAIALAGGTNRTAKLSGVRIIHRGPAGMTETPVQLKKILEAKASDQSLEAEDILFVPSSAGKVAVGRTLEAAIQAATAVSIVAIHP
jgi:polysaccharide export outer membrane protein